MELQRIGAVKATHTKDLETAGSYFSREEVFDALGYWKFYLANDLGPEAA